MPLDSVVKYRFLSNKQSSICSMILRQSHHKAHKTQQLNICAKLFYLQKQNGTKWQQGSHIHAQSDRVLSRETLFSQQGPWKSTSQGRGNVCDQTTSMYVYNLRLNIFLPPNVPRAKRWSQYIFPIYSVYDHRVQETKTGGPYWKEFSFQDALLILKHSKCVEGNLNL